MLLCCVRGLELTTLLLPRSFSVFLCGVVWLCACMCVCVCVCVCASARVCVDQAAIVNRSFVIAILDNGADGMYCAVVAVSLVV